MQGDLIIFVRSAFVQFRFFQTGLYLQEVGLTDLPVIETGCQHVCQFLHNIDILAHDIVHAFTGSSRPVVQVGGIHDIIRRQVFRLGSDLSLYLGGLVIVVDLSASIDRLTYGSSQIIGVMIHFDSHAGTEIQIVLIDTVLVAAGEIDSREESGLGRLDSMLHRNTLFRTLFDLAAIFKHFLLVVRSRDGLFLCSHR